jgi:response regulator RpfG family c-di-GMP phosphodiesterase
MAMAQQVLIIDDNAVNVVLFKALMKRFDNCQVHAFTCPVTALDWTRDQTPDMVILDYMMPGMDGLSFLEQFLSDPKHADTPVLMITANDQKDVRYRALGAGASDFLTKPVDKVEFLARVKHMLTLSEARKSLTHRAEWLAQEVRKATEEILLREREIVMRLCRAAEFRDPETGEHLQRMAHYSSLIAKRLGMTQAEQDLIFAAAPMHDVGKVGIIDKILLKPGRFDEAEFEQMKSHAEIGYQLLQGSSSKTLQIAAEIARGHHEKWDGSGYPQGLSGEDIPVHCRIVAVADVFDALTSERPYKKAWSLESALAHLEQGRGTHFDPKVVDAFVQGWDEVVAIRQRFVDA